MTALKSVLGLVSRVLPALGIVVILLAVSAAVVTAPGLPAGSLPAAVLPGAVVSLTNTARAQEGVALLTRNSKLDQAAQMKAEDMAKKGYYAHVAPDGTTPMHWVEKAGYSYLMVGENLVVNRDSAREVVEAFMGSSGHRANILRSDFTEIGVGVANGTYKSKDATFIVQIFAKPRVEAPKPAKPVVVVTTAPAVKASAPQTVQAKLAKEVEKVIAPVVAVLQATSTPEISSSTAPAIEPVVPIFSIAPSVAVEVETRTPEPAPLAWHKRFASSLGTLWASIESLWKR
jgi:hypothetical protein